MSEEEKQRSPRAAVQSSSGADTFCLLCSLLQDSRRRSWVDLLSSPWEPRDSGTVKRKQWDREQPRKGEAAFPNTAGQILRNKNVGVGRDIKGYLAWYLSPGRGSSLLAGGAQTWLAPFQWQEDYLL